jgi:excisionase family DNA binding protein
MAQPERPQPYLEAGKVARLLHVSPKTISRWAAEGKLPFVRTIGGHRRFDPTVIGALVERLNHIDRGAE